MHRPARFIFAAALLIPLASARAADQPGTAPSPDPLPTVSDEVTVTATRTEQRLGTTAASMAVLSAGDLAASAAPTLDDALRQVPGFSLFRRSGSRFANPTTQGVSLRGLGASGASRALVLADGVPLNDPFGGWIAWGRVPRAAVSRIEVMRGAGSDLYGSSALGGVVQLLRRQLAGPQIVADGSWGERGSADGSLFAAGSWKSWGASLATESSRTDGYVLVEPAVRGPVDTPAGSRHTTIETTLERHAPAGARMFLRASRFTEERTNGTPLQVNDSDFRQWSAGDDTPAGRGFLSLRAWGGDQGYRQTFSAVAANRASERLLRSQSVPAETVGGSAQWSRPLSDRHVLVAGAELREVHGASDETVFGTGPSILVSAGGRQRTRGLYLEDVARLTPRVSFTLGGRFDRWDNAQQHHGERRSESAVSPRATLLVQATERWAWTASAYKAFRAPTLNELYRAFRVGDVLTVANADLRAERLTGGETGALFSRSGGRLTARGTLFWMEVDHTIANVTLSSTPTLITRQRQNLGTTRSRGIEAEITARTGDRWTLTGGWLLSDARVKSAPADPTLEGLRIPQVPRNQATLQLRFDNPRFLTVGLQARWSSAQFDDDQNRFLLRSATTLDVLISRSLDSRVRGLTAFAAAENLLNAQVDIGRTPLRTLGPPRMVRAGIRFER